MSELIILAMQQAKDFNLLEQLNSLLDENHKILESIYDRDLYIKGTMSKLIDLHPDLYKLNSVLNGELNWLANVIGLKVSNNEIEIDNPYLNTEIKKPKKKANISCKILYRKISRLTHPDKIKNEKLNKYFITAKKLYKSQDLIALQELYDLVIAELENIEDDVLLQRINKIKDEIENNKNTFIILELSEDYVIAVKYNNPNTKDEATQLFIEKINKINENLLFQINDIKSKFFGVPLNA